jgi:prepilin-type N-terminal cleavage/methylation domain-containing protein
MSTIRRKNDPNIPPREMARRGVGGRGAASRGTRASGFTLLELLLAVSVLALVSTITYVAFATVTTAWKRGTALSDELHHADFVMEQVVAGLRSAYYQDRACGFWLTDNGDGEGASDEISWVKLGSAIVGDNCPFQGTPHRVRLLVEPDEDGEQAVVFTAWRMRGQAEDFKPEELDPVVLSKGIVGFNCRPRDPDKKNEVEWIDDWEDDRTNKLPTAVELTLYLRPLEKGGEPIEVKRIVEIPVALLSWTGGSASPPPLTLTPPTGTLRPTPVVPPGGGRGRGGTVLLPVPGRPAAP